jgi:hypothetical protein
VPIASSDLTDAGLPADASEALLRRAALAPLSDIRVVGEQASDGVELVTVSYQAGPHAGTSTFRVERAGWVGLAPPGDSRRARWR